MNPEPLQILPLEGLPEIQPGDPLEEFLLAAIRRTLPRPKAPLVLVVAQKVVSKAEGQIIRLEEVSPSPLALAWGRRHGKDPRVVEVVLGQSRRILRMSRGVLISQTRHGYICANAGVDHSNVPEGCVTLLPRDPDASARQLHAYLQGQLKTPLAVIISDTFGRPWRRGLCNVALGLAGMEGLVDYRGRYDDCGRELRATVLARADEVASAAELVMGKTRRIPAALVVGYPFTPAPGNGSEMLRPEEEDLFP